MLQIFSCKSILCNHHLWQNFSLVFILPEKVTSSGIYICINAIIIQLFVDASILVKVIPLINCIIHNVCAFKSLFCLMLWTRKLILNCFSILRIYFSILCLWSLFCILIINNSYCWLQSWDVLIVIQTMFSDSIVSVSKVLSIIIYFSLSLLLLIKHSWLWLYTQWSVRHFAWVKVLQSIWPCLHFVQTS